MKYLQQFIDECLTAKDKATLSEPMNTKHARMYEVYVKGIEMGKSL